MKTKQQALADYLECEPSELEESRHDDCLFELGSKEYLVLTASEADERAREGILNSLWAFNPEFIAAHTKKGLSDGAVKALVKAQAELCEDAGDLVESMIEDLDHFVDDAIRADGGGHFLNTYDGDENQAGKYFVYRVN